MIYATTGLSPKSGPIFHCDAHSLLGSIPLGTVELVQIDPPFCNIVQDKWDRQWKTDAEYVDWLVGILGVAKKRLTPTGSILMFGAIGKHGSHPFFDVINRCESELGLCFRNLITWKKRRAYGTQFNYLWCREEIVWFSNSHERTEVTFNIPLLDVVRGYPGFSKKYVAKSEFKRVSNVFDDIPELMRPSRACEKPIPLLRRLISTHSNPGDLVVDIFAGTGSTGQAALDLGRRFVGCDTDLEAVTNANIRLRDCGVMP